jgi:hypothetical protein
MQTVAWILFQHCSVLVSQMPIGAQKALLLHGEA